MMLFAFLASVALATNSTAAGAPLIGVDKLTNHNDRARTGWNANERVLTPRKVAGGAFRPLWQSPELDAYHGKPPRIFATPLYVHSVEITNGPQSGLSVPVAYVVTSTAFIYAIATAGPKVPPGTILWRTKLSSTPCLDGEMGNLSTPVIDAASRRIFVESCDSDAGHRIHSLDLGSGIEEPGWPVAIDSETIDAQKLNRNGTRHFAHNLHLQRGALALSANGRRLYVTFGEGGDGWLVSVDTAKAAIASAFSSTANDNEDQGGMWASGGPSIDAEGRIQIVAGANSANTIKKMKIAGVYPASDGDWGGSILQFRDDLESGLSLLGTYSPFNYCLTVASDVDVASSGTVVIDLPAGSTSTPHLMLLGGGKQGNFYLLDRDHLPGGVIRRQPCSTDPESDGSLLAPDPQPQFGELKGPLNLFGPYSDYAGMLDEAKSRSTAAIFRDASGRTFAFVTGSAKSALDLSQSMPPGLARVEIVVKPGHPAYPQISQLESTQTFYNPGSPIVSSDGSSDAIVWVLDENAPRGQSLYGDSAPKPELYAFDAVTLRLLWKSAPGVLHASGKYNEPTVVDGLVLVGTDRLQAFGLAPIGETASSSKKLGQSATRARSPVVRPRPSENIANRANPQTLSMTGPGAGAVDGKAIFQTHCSGCHDAGRPGIPARSMLSTFTRQRIIDALSTGPMKPMAHGLNEKQIEAIASYLKK